MVLGKGVQADSFQQNLQNKPVGREETFFNVFANLSHFSGRAFFGTNLLWQFVEILVGMFSS